MSTRVLKRQIDREEDVEKMIAPEAKIGTVDLIVTDLQRSVGFYQERLGFQVLDRQERRAVLGAGGRRLLALTELAEAKPRDARMTGLYHFAVLLPSRRALAHLLIHLAENETEIEGAADHGVSEALYLSDPDGNGIELYCDRRRSDWPVDDLGKLQMGTEELDVDNLILTLKNGLPAWEGLPDQTVIGHIHLQVADLAACEAFYTRVLGFQLTQRYGSRAIFVSAGGYHHHIGMNTWASAGAPPPPEDMVGLRWFEVLLPGADVLEAVRARLEAAGTPWEEREGGVLVRDPARNGLLIQSV